MPSLKTKNILIIFQCFSLVLFSFFNGFSQQNPGLSFYSFQTNFQNPASVGLKEESSFQVNYRNQWTQYQSTYDGSGNLGTSIASLSLSLKPIPVGLGLMYLNDLTPSGAGLQFLRAQSAYHLEMGSGIISLGFSAGLATKSFDGRVFKTRDPNDPIANEISGKSIAKSSLDFGAGISYSLNNWTIGAAIDHLNSPTFSFTSSLNGSTNLQPVFLVHSSYELPILEKISLNPFLQWRSYQGQNVLDLGMRVKAFDLFWLGGNFRSNDSFTGMFGLNLLNNSLEFGYALDQNFINQNLKAPLSHELFLKFKLPDLQLIKKRNNVVPINTPRYKIN